MHTRSILKFALSTLALATIFGPTHAFADQSEEPIKYVLETSTVSVPLGQSPGVRLLVQSASSTAILHGLKQMSAYELRIHGPAGYGAWPFQQYVSQPEAFQLAPGERKYLFGTATSYLYPDAIVFEKPGVYHLQYCDRWLVKGEEREICSNRVKVRVGDVGDGDE